MIPDRILAQATALADGRTGAVLNQDPAGAGNARGFKGGWVIPATVLNAAAPTSGSQGRLVSYVSMQKGLGAELQGKWLSRIATGDEADNRMETNINAGGNGITNLSVVTGRGLIAAADNNVYSDGTAPVGQLSVDGNLVLGGRRLADGAVSSDADNSLRVDAPRIVAREGDGRRGGDGKPLNPGLMVSGNAMINDLSANRINADTVVYDGTGTRAFPDGIKLTDLIPNHVVKSSWIARDGDFVPKPDTCGGSANTQNLSRIFVIPGRERSWR